MDVEALRASPIGRLVPISWTEPMSGARLDYWAYCAAPLPEAPNLKYPTINAASEAAMQVARLDQAVSQLPNTDILVRPIVQREATSTSALEGTYASFDDVLESDFIEENQMTYEQREIRNYVLATYEGVELLKTLPLSRGMIGRLQARIVKGTSGEAYDSGDLRQRLVAIGATNRPIEESRFVPIPNGQQLEEGFSDWEKWVNSEGRVPIVIRIALGHYQFETLHPYSDGNGRLGRLIAILQLIQDGALGEPVLNLAPWLEQHRDEYQDGLLRTTLTGTFDPWVEFFSTAVEEQARDGIAKISKLLDLRAEMQQLLRQRGARGSVVQIAENLIGYPVIDVSTARSIIDKTFETANQAISRLVDEGILREITGRRQNRLFLCQRVFDIIRS